MNKTVHYIGLDVHKETIAVAITPAGSREVRDWGIIGGTLNTVDKLLQKLLSPAIKLRVSMKPVPAAMSSSATSKPKASTATWSRLGPTSISQIGNN